MKKLLALSFAAGVAMLVAPSQADACRCMPPRDAATKKAAADGVFYGKLTSVSGARAGARTGQRAFKFTVARGYKGVSSKTLTVKSAASGSMCGASFRIGTNYVVYAHKSGRTFTTSSCSGNTSGANANKELSALGQYWAPTLANGACPRGTSNVIRCIRAPCPVKCMSTAR